MVRSELSGSLQDHPPLGTQAGTIDLPPPLRPPARRAPPHRRAGARVHDPRAGERDRRAPARAASCRRGWRARCCAPARPASRSASSQMRHWFDGLAMLHRFTIAGGGVSYGGRYLQGRSYRAARERGEIAYGEFATDPCRSIFKRVQSLFHPGAALTDNANVNVTRLGERFIAMTETPLPVQFDPQHARHRRGAARSPRPASSPPPTPTSTAPAGAMLNYAARLGARSSYRFFRVHAGLAGGRGDRLDARPQARLHALLRPHRALPGAGRVPLRGQPAGPRAGAAALHRELPLEAPAGHALHALSTAPAGRSRASCAPTPASPSTTSTPSTTAGRWWWTCAPTRTPASSRTSTSSGCARASRWRGPSWRASGSTRSAARWSANGSSRTTSSCRGSTTGAATSGPTATHGDSRAGRAASSSGS